MRKRTGIVPSQAIFGMMLGAFLGAALGWAAPALAQFAEEDATDTGVLNPADFSWRSYQEQMRRFPDRLGFICMNAYWLDKTSDHDSSLKFFIECSRRGNVPSMIYLAHLYETGWHGHPADLPQAAHWLKRGAETGYPLAQFHWGVALLLGRGVPQDTRAGKDWIAKAAAHGDSAAQEAVDADFQLGPDGKPLHLPAVDALSLVQSPQRMSCRSTRDADAAATEDCIARWAAPAH